MAETISIRQGLVILAIWAGVALIGSVPVNYPIHYDEAIYFVMSQAVAEGAVPYRDLMEIKGPAIFYLYGLFFRYLPAPAAAIHLLCAALSLLMGFACYRILRLAELPPTAAVAVAFWCLIGWNGLAHENSSPDRWVGWLAFFAFWCLLAGWRHRFHPPLACLLAGVLMGLAPQFKLNALFDTLGIGIAILTLFDRDRLRWLGWYALGFLLGNAFVLLPLTLSGGWQAYLESLQLIGEYGQLLPLTATPLILSNYLNALKLSQRLALFVLSIFLGAGAILVRAYRRRFSPLEKAALLWFLLELVGLLAGRRGYLQYFTVLFPAGSLLLGLALRDLKLWSHPRLSLALTGLMLLLTGHYGWSLYHAPESLEKLNYPGHASALRSWLSGSTPDYPARRVGEYLGTHFANRRVLVIGFEAAHIYWWSRQRALDRFLHPIFLMDDLDLSMHPERFHRKAPIATRFRAEWVRQHTLHPPDVIALTHTPASLERLLVHLEPLLREHYHQVGKVEGYELFVAYPSNP